MRRQATRNVDIVRAQKRRRAVRDALIGIPVALSFIAIMGYAVAGLVTPN